MDLFYVGFLEARKLFMSSCKLNLFIALGKLSWFLFVQSLSSVMHPVEDGKSLQKDKDTPVSAPIIDLPDQ